MKTLVYNIKTLSQSLSGGINKKSITQGERLNKVALSKGVYSNKFLSKGTVLEEERSNLCEPMLRITPEEVNFYIGKTTTKDLKINDPLSKSCFEINKTVDNFNNISNYGIPVRFRDLEAIQNEFAPTFLEYHMFSTDLNIDPNEYSKLLKGKIYQFIHQNNLKMDLY